MSSEHFKPNDQPDVKSKTHDKPKWVMTQRAFDKLLTSFSTNRDEAGEQYERMRIKLSRVFEWQSVGPAEELTDETFNRVARRLDEGQSVDNLIAYTLGVAKIICKEARKKIAPVSLDETPESRRQVAPEPVEPDARLRCFDHCLDELPREKQYLIVEYYQQERRDKIDRRQRLADRLGIPLNALRIRAHRIRMALENCIKMCLESQPARND